MEDNFEDLIGEDPPPENASDLVLGQNRSIVKMFMDPGIMAKFVKVMKNSPFEAIDDAIIGPAYAAMLWQFRAAALAGDTDTTRAIKTWLDWAKPIIAKPKHEKPKVNNAGAAAFGPREVKPVEDE